MNQTQASRPLSQDCINWKSRYLNTVTRLAQADPLYATDRAWLEQYLSTPLVREELDRIFEALPEDARPKGILTFDPWYRTHVMGMPLLPSMKGF